MRIDTLSYKYQIDVSKQLVYEVIRKEQETYFRSKGYVGKGLNEGAAVTLSMTSKLGATSIPASIQLSKLNENEIELLTSHSKGTITQKYRIDERSDSKTQVIYTEKNAFTHARNQYSFIFLAFVYKFFYNRGMKKRMVYLEKQCYEKEDDAK